MARDDRTPAGVVGASPETAPFTITFDERELPVLPGQSIAAALWSAEILAWRSTRVGGARAGRSAGSASATTVSPPSTAARTGGRAWSPPGPVTR